MAVDDTAATLSSTVDNTARWQCCKANGMTIDESLAEYEGLAKEEIMACLLFASHALEDSPFMPLEIEAG